MEAYRIKWKETHKIARRETTEKEQKAGGKIWNKVDCFVDRKNVQK
jgi:hypothetical protein